MNQDHQRAFSLVEALAVTFLISTLLSLALPSLQGVIERNRSQAVQDSLKSSLHVARTHSINYGLNVELCGSSDGQICDHVWRAGWLVRERTSQKVIHIERLTEHPLLVWRGLSKQIRFIPTGHSHASNGTFTLCNHNARVVWQIKLNRQGRARAVKTDELSSTPCINT